MSPDYDGVGSNLWRYSANDDSVDGETVADTFYKGHVYYEWYGDEPDFTDYDKWGCFTQLVWKATSEVGLGCATENGLTYVVALYQPGGNVLGQFKDNVLEGDKKKQ